MADESLINSGLLPRVLELTATPGWDGDAYTISPRVTGPFTLRGTMPNMQTVSVRTAKLNIIQSL